VQASYDQLQKWRHGLVEARATGVRSVTDQNGERVEYRNDSELASALALVDAEIRRFNTNPPNTIYLTTSKGL
jgi:hypothetical protein